MVDGLVRRSSARLRHGIAIALLCWSTGLHAGVPVLLSFDVESNDDRVALESLRFEGPATYFVLGEYAERHPDFVAELSTLGTIGSHGYAHQDLTELDDGALHQDLLLSKMVLENIVERPVVWLRAPYCATDERVAAAARKIGFVYDSSHQERWILPGQLRQLPVTTLDAERALASDYDLLEQLSMPDSSIVSMLCREYDRRAASERPFVFLLHPKIIARRPAVLTGFVEYTRRAGGLLMSFDEYLTTHRTEGRRTLGFWIDFSLGERDLDLMVQDLVGVGATDAFLMARSPEGVVHAALIDDTAGSDIFGDALGRLKAAGIRVHAWLPVHLNRKAAADHPDWRMLSQNGTPSDDWISPSHPEVRADHRRTVVSLLDRYDLDGLHLDYIRYPDLNHDYSEAALETFTRATGFQLNTDRPVETLLTTRYSDWTDWRAEQIAAVVTETRDILRRSPRPGASLSAALLAQSPESYRVREYFGQNFGRLAADLDILIPMTYHKEERRSVDWIPEALFAARVAVGSRRLLAGVSAYRKTGEWTYSVPEFEAAFRRGVEAAEGVVVYPYLHAFARGGNAQNMAAGVGGAIRRAMADPGVGRVERETSPWLWPGLGIAVAMAVAGVTIAVRRRAPSSASTLATPLAAPARSWQELEAELQAEQVPTSVCEEVAAYLKGIDAGRIANNRLALILELADGGADVLATLDRGIGVSGWRVLGLRYLEEALLLGLLQESDGAYEVTAEGARHLSSALDAGYAGSEWRFIERRLHESLSVECPECGHLSNSTHWIWPSFDCVSCGRKEIAISRCETVRVRPASVASRSYLSF